MKNPLISVLVPVYNAEKYIHDTLFSIVNQSYRNLEIIVLNDGSTDSSGDIIKSVSDDRIRYIFRENRGVGNARNTLLSLAEGEMILFVDADDILSSDFIEKLFLAKERTKSGIASSSVVPFRGKRPKEKEGNGESTVCTGREFVRLMVKPAGVFCYSHSRLFDRALFEGLSFPEDRIFEDIVLMPQVVLRTDKVVLVPDAVYHYRINRQGLSHGPFSLRALDEMNGYLSNIELGLKIGDGKIVYYSGLFFLTKYYYYYWRVLFRGLGIRSYLERFKEEKTRVIRLLKGKSL